MLMHVLCQLRLHPCWPFSSAATSTGPGSLALELSIQPHARTQPVRTAIHPLGTGGPGDEQTLVRHVVGRRGDPRGGRGSVGPYRHVVRPKVLYYTSIDM